MTASTQNAFEEELRLARAAAFGAGEYIGQESFVTGTEVLALADQAHIGPGVSVLDLCCGTGGPGRFITRNLGCTYLGVDVSRTAVEDARRRATAAGLRCRFEVRLVPPLPQGRFDAVLMLETLLAFPERAALLRAVAGALPPGGHFALSVEAGRPLSPVEASVMPESDTVNLTPLDQLVADLAREGLRLRWHQDWTDSHLRTVDALVGAYQDTAARIHDVEQREAVDRLLTAHRLWSRWLRDGRVRKHALVTERCG